MNDSAEAVLLKPYPTPGRRDPRIDAWRGLCLLGMVAWHLLTDPSFPRWFSFGIIQGFNFVAEGFVLLAGAAVGMGLARSAGLPLRIGHYLRRALGLFGVHALLAAILWFVFRADNAHGPGDFPSALAAVGAILTLHYQPYLGDVLSVFVFLFAATPLLLALQRTLGQRGLFVVSLLAYLAANLAYDPRPEAWWRLLEPNDRGAFDFGSWQFVFVLGLLLGQHRQRLYEQAERWFGRLLLVGAMAFAVAFVYRLGVEKGGPWSQDLPLFLLFDRQPLTPARLIYILLQMLLIALVTVRLWAPIADRWPTRLLELFGRHSLTVFAALVVLDYALKAAIKRLGWGFPLNLTLLVVELAVLVAVARWLERPLRPVLPGKGDGSSKD